MGHLRHTLSASHTDPSRFNLKAETALVFPQGGSDARFGTGRGQLTRGIVDAIIPIARRPDGMGRDGCKRLAQTGRGQTGSLTRQWQQLGSRNLIAHGRGRRLGGGLRRGDAVGIAILRIGSGMPVRRGGGLEDRGMGVLLLVVGQGGGGGGMGSIGLARGQMRTVDVHVRLSLVHGGHGGARAGVVAGVVGRVVGERFVARNKRESRMDDGR